MTTISRPTASSPEFNYNALPRKMKIVEGDPKDQVIFKPVELTAQQKAEVAQTKAISAAVVAASEKQLQAAQKTLKADSHEMYLPNISTLSLENAQKSLGIAELMMKNREDVGVNVHGRYGDREISDLKSYTAAVKDYIGKYNSSEPLTTASSSHVVQVGGAKQNPASAANASTPSGTGAVSIYRQMQESFGGAYRSNMKPD